MSQIDFYGAMMMYSNAFHDSPPVANFNEDMQQRAIPIILQAVADKKPLSDAEFYRKMGLPEPPKGVAL